MSSKDGKQVKQLILFPVFIWVASTTLSHRTLSRWLSVVEASGVEASVVEATGNNTGYKKPLS